MNSTAPSRTMPKELPEMDPGKEVHVQDGEEHVASNSMAASEINGDMGIEKQGEESEEGTRPAAIGTAAGASYLHPLVLEENESDSKDQTWINHPPSSPDGSLLHAVYFQLLGAGFDGMTVRELFRSRVHTWRKPFTKPVAALAEPEMEFDGMPTVRELIRSRVPGRVHTWSKAFKKPVAALAEPEMEFDGMPTVRELIRSRVHTWSKAFKKPVAALAEPEMEFDEMHQSMGDKQMPSRVENQDDDSNGQQLQQSRRYHVAPQNKTAANMGSLKFKGQSRTRTTRPLPPHIGVRKNPSGNKKKGSTRPVPPHIRARGNTPVKKKNKGYLKNRLLGEETRLHSQEINGDVGTGKQGEEASLHSQEIKGDVGTGKQGEEASLHSQVSQ